MLTLLLETWEQNAGNSADNLASRLADIGTVGEAGDGGRSGDCGGAGAEVREQRAGSVGVILSQKDLAMSSAAQHEETLKAWRDM